jgi:hypothetical protein
MVNRRIVWLLTAVIALGVASGAPMVRAEVSGGTCAIVCIAIERAERQEPIRNPERIAEEAAPGNFFQCDVPRITRFLWPSTWQRPPTHGPQI